MTLSTDIYVLDKIDPMEVFNYCNTELLGVTEPRFSDGESTWDKGTRRIMNAPGQGLNAWLTVSASLDGSPLHREDVYEDDDDLEDGPYLMSPKTYLTINFDTGYSYKDEYGGCETLHRRYIENLHDWLSEKGIAIRWRDEFTGDIHDGLNGLKGFGFYG